jgi:putative membrane protein
MAEENCVTVRTASILLALLGLALITGIMTWLGAGAVMKAVLSVGFGGFALLVLWQIASDFVLAVAWRIGCPRPALDIGIGSLLLARMIREAGTTCLPFSQIGGILIGMRATCFGFGRALAWPTAAAANIVDITAEIIGQVAFVLLGLVFLIDRRPDTNLAGPVALGMVLGIAAIAAFIWTQRRASGLFRRGVGSLGHRLTEQFLAGPMLGIESLQDRINIFYSRPGRIAAASLVHLTGWIGSAVWVWLAYRLLGAPIGLGSALAIEGVASGILSVSFLMPAALGVQEAAYVALGSLFGLDPHLSFGLSLLRRGRDLSIGVPTLLFWQWMEVARLRAGKIPALD